jgi:hypothetical protein
LRRARLWWKHLRLSGRHWLATEFYRLRELRGGLEVYKKVLELEVSPEELKGCIGRQGSLWDWLITPAHAGDICGVITQYFSNEDIKTCLELWDRMKSGAGRYAAEGMEAFIKAYEQDPKSFKAIFAAMDLPGEIARMLVFTPEERVKFEAMIASDTQKAIAALQPYLDGLLTKVQNGELDPEEAALIATTAFVFIAKFAPKKLRRLLVSKTKDSFKKISQAVKWKKTQGSAINTTNRELRSVDDVLASTKLGRPTKGKTTQFERDGGIQQANSDFDSLGVQNVRVIETPKGTIRTGTLADGRTVTVRGFSSDGRPTLEIRGSNGRGEEIRYD